MVARQSALARTREENVPRQTKALEALTKAHDALPDLDRLIHERIRLGIISALAANSSLSFNDLKRLLKTTDGNLSVHARKLEDAGYIACTKSFEGRMPRTEYALTASGRKALEKYLNHMEALIHAMRSPDGSVSGKER
jgi:DNA-binding MarR family transcriptional regulator